MAGFLAFAVLHARAVGIEAWSAVLMVFGSTIVTCRVVLAKLPDRVAPTGLAAAALGMSAAGCVVVGAVPTPVGLVAGTVVLAIGTALLTPAVFAAVFRAVAPSERGSAAATTSIFLDLGFSGGPMLLGIVAASTSIPTAFLVLAGVPIAGASVLALTGLRGAALASR